MTGVFVEAYFEGYFRYKATDVLGLRTRDLKVGVHPESPLKVVTVVHPDAVTEVLWHQIINLEKVQKCHMVVPCYRLIMSQSFWIYVDASGARKEGDPVGVFFLWPFHRRDHESMVRHMCVTMFPMMDVRTAEEWGIIACGPCRRRCPGRPFRPV